MAAADSGKFDIQVSSGVDWFELHGEAEFGDTAAQLPRLLSALRRGENVVKLGDGSFGVLPQQWLKQHGMLASLDSQPREGRSGIVAVLNWRIAIVARLGSEKRPVIVRVKTVDPQAQELPFNSRSFSNEPFLSTG